ncbi:MAG: hypothetical protein ACLQIQ_10460 [Beijerinckiaceae bacterium]
MFALDVDGITKTYPDIDDPYFIALLPKIKDFTITTCRGAEATWSLYKAIEYIVKALRDFVWVIFGCFHNSGKLQVRILRRR